MISKRSPFFASVAGVLVLVLNVSAAEVLDPAKADRGNDEWRMRQGERVADVRNNAEKLQVLFIGDSITGGWLNIGKAGWEKNSHSCGQHRYFRQSDLAHSLAVREWRHRWDPSARGRLDDRGEQ